MSRILLLPVALVVTVMLLTGDAPVLAGKARVDVCHAEDDGSFRLITVAESAVPAHLGHGYGLPGDAVPGMDGFAFGEDCTAETDFDTIAPDCYRSSVYSDLWYDGPIDTPGNVVGWTSFDGTCSGFSFGGGEAIIRAPDLAGALAKCESLDLEINEFLPYPLAGPEYGYEGLPDDAWICNVR